MATTTISATTAIKRLAERHGMITPQIVLAAARRATSPLHSHFLWDDTAAAEKYRLVQAALLIRKIKVEYTVSPQRIVQVRAFHNVREDPNVVGGYGIYATTEDVMQSDAYRNQLFDQCRRDIRAFREKYAMLQEVAQVIAAMETAELQIPQRHPLPA